MKNETIYFQSDVEKVFQKLTSNWNELNKFYNDEAKLNYEVFNEKLDYIDIAIVSRFIVDKMISGQTENFLYFFNNVEEILIKSDKYVQELIVIGLFEGIQNIGGSDIDYYHSFEKWLKSNSLKSWRELIDFWDKAQKEI